MYIVRAFHHPPNERGYTVITQSPYNTIEQTRIWAEANNTTATNLDILEAAIVVTVESEKWFTVEYTDYDVREVLVWNTETVARLHYENHHRSDRPMFVFKGERQ